MSTLAIDQGTTSTRAFIAAADGSMRQLASLTHQQFYPAPGFVEHDGEELISNIKRCLAADDLNGIDAIGIDNQGESCLGWNAETGKPVGPVIVWQDARTAAVTDRLRAEGAEQMVLERAGLPLDPYFSASKLGWILSENQEARRLADRGLLRLGTTDAFFHDRLTGRFETDITTASRTSLMDLETGQWDDELCRLFRVPLNALPKIRPSTGDFGAIRCGGRMVPVTASIVDQQASLYGHGCREAGDAKITFGTGAFALQVTSRLQRPSPDGPLPTVAWQKAGEMPTYALDGGVYCASSALNWAQSLGLFSNFSEIDAFKGPPAIARGLVFVPALAGLACPHWDRSARGAWFGLSLDTHRLDMMRAVLEGVALRTSEVVAAMTRLSPPSDPISIDGGMTSNAYFCQFLADCLQRDVVVSAEPELTAIGTAALAAEAAGRPFDIPRIGRRLRPQPFQDSWRTKFTTAVTAVRTVGS